MSQLTGDPTLLHPLVLAGLQRFGITAEVVPCDPDLADTAAFCAAYGYSPDDSANTILVTGKAAEPVHVACVVLASTRLQVNSTVRRRLGVRKASFTDSTHTVALSGMQIGGVTAIGLPDGLPIWVDSAVTSRETIILGGGNRSSKLLLAPSELLALSAVEIVDDLAATIPPAPSAAT